MGTPQFLFYMTIFCVFWLIWNTWAPEAWRFDSAALGFTALTLMLSLQASYAAPLLLLAQNRQDDRDRVSLPEDRGRAERNLSDTEYLTRELAALRIALRDVATRDYVRSELRCAARGPAGNQRRRGAEPARQDRQAPRRGRLDQHRAHPAGRPADAGQRTRHTNGARTHDPRAAAPRSTCRRPGPRAAPSHHRAGHGRIGVSVDDDGTARVGVLLTIAGCPLRSTIDRDVAARAGRGCPGSPASRSTLGVMSPEQRAALRESLGPGRAGIPFSDPAR